MPGNFTLDFFEDDAGRAPVVAWLEKLESWKYAAATTALERVLAHWGQDVCRTEWGKPLGEGLFELRIRHTEAEIAHMFGDGEVDGDRTRGKVLLRIFFHPHGQGRILLLHGYDKGKAPGQTAQKRQIERARANLKAFRLRQRRL